MCFHKWPDLGLSSFQVGEYLFHGLPLRSSGTWIELSHLADCPSNIQSGTGDGIYKRPNSLTIKVKIIQEKEKLYQRGFCIEQGFIPPRGDIRQLHVTFTWCDDNVPRQVTKHRHEQIYMNYTESNMIITMRRRIDEIKHTLREKWEILLTREQNTLTVF